MQYQYSGTTCTFALSLLTVSWHTPLQCPHSPTSSHILTVLFSSCRVIASSYLSFNNNLKYCVINTKIIFPWGSEYQYFSKYCVSIRNDCIVTTLVPANPRGLLFVISHSCFILSVHFFSWLSHSGCLWWLHIVVFCLCFNYCSVLGDLSQKHTTPPAQFQLMERFTDVMFD